MGIWGHHGDMSISGQNGDIMEIWGNGDVQPNGNWLVTGTWKSIGGAIKARLDVALGSLVWCLETLRLAGGLKLDDHCGPFQHRPFYVSTWAVGTGG